MNVPNAVMYLKAALAELEGSVIPPVIPNPVEPVGPIDYVPVGGTLHVHGEIRVSCVGTAALFSGFFTEKVRLTCTPIRGGGRMIPVELIANGEHMGMGPDWPPLAPGSYQLILKGGSQMKGAEQSVKAMPAPNYGG